MELAKRIDDRPLPKVEVIDLRTRQLAPGQTPASAPRQLAPALSQALTETLSRGEQAILFLNRRGHSTFITCAVCGLTLKCPNCSISLTHHVHILEMNGDSYRLAHSKRRRSKAKSDEPSKQ